MDRKKFYETFRAKFGLKRITTDLVAGMEAVLDAIDGLPLSWQAYALATSWHETNATMRPVREAYWLSEDWRRRNLRYYPWYGRGYVQLTWRTNYIKADKECAAAGLCPLGAIIASPDKVMELPIAAFILRKGMLEGWFTGVRFSSCLPARGVATRKQYMDARTIINGRDKADLIEDYAQWFERALRDAGLT